MIAIGSDHRGYKLKEHVKEFLEQEGFGYVDFGTDSEERVDSLPIITRVCKSIQEGVCDRGILICGTGLAMCITANKFKRIMCTLCNDELSSVRSREHNDSNILCLGERVVGEGLALDICKAWLKGVYEGGRHQRRVEMIDN